MLQYESTRFFRSSPTPRRRAARTRVLLALGLSSLACGRPEAKSAGDDQAFDQSMQQVCEVDKLGGFDPETNLIGIEADRYDWMMSNVKHPDAIELITLMRVEAESKRAEMLRQALTRTKHKRCTLADHYAQAAP